VVGDLHAGRDRGTRSVRHPPSHLEKPFTVTSAEADDLNALARRRDLRLSVFHQRRWDGDHLTVAPVHPFGCARPRQHVHRATTASGPEPGQRRAEEARPGAGVLYDLGSHLIDQALSLFGVPATVFADLFVQCPGGVVDDYFHLVLGYGTLRVILHAGTLVCVPGPRFEVHGDAGSLVTRGAERRSRRCWPDGGRATRAGARSTRTSGPP
jgi:scyllo-inositol 2-dehydrogenase (NADP+)